MITRAQKLYLKNKEKIIPGDRRRLTVPAFVPASKKSAYVPNLSRIFLKEEKLKYLAATKTKNLASRSKAWLYKFLGENENKFFDEDYFLNLPNQIKILETHFRIETQTFFVLFTLINSDTFFLIEVKTQYQPQTFGNSVLRLFSFFESDFENEKEDGTYNFIQLI